MDVSERKNRIKRLEPHLPYLSKFQEPRVQNKSTLVLIMKDLKDEGNMLFKEACFETAGLFYNYALVAARQLERTFYHSVEREFLAVLYCNAALCSLKIENYKEALKDAEAALTFQPGNIKAMYRRASALEGLGRLNEAMKQALKGQMVDTKNNFDDLVSGLRAKLFAQEQPGKSTEIKVDKSNSKSSNRSLADTTSEKKKKEQMKDMSSKKIKKGQSQQKTQQGSKKKQPTGAVSVPRPDSDVDSDSIGSDDESQFAQRMASVQGATVKGAGKPAASAVAAGVPGAIGKGGGKHVASASANSSGPGQRSSPVTSGSSTKGTMGLDSFSGGPGGAVSSRPSKPSMVWPLEQVDFRLVCRLCFVKEREGIGGCTLKANLNHACLRDVLIVRSKSNTSLNWLKIRPRLVTPGVAHTFQYKLCMQFQRGLPCRLNEARCTFAHSPLETNFWNMDRDGTFSIANFIKEAKDKGVFSSEMAVLTSSREIPAERYIPGMASSVRPQAESLAQPVAQHAPAAANHQPPPNPQASSTVRNGPVGTKSPPSFSMPPPSAPPGYMAKPPPTNQLPVSNGNQPHPINAQQRPHSQAQAAPRVANPFPNLECRLLCPACLQFTGRPWFYVHTPNLSHQCQQSILAYRVVDEFNRVVWVQVRERASHRYFKGSYMICHSVTTANPDLCKFKELCSFAHSQVEQAIWKLEQEGSYDIGEFMVRNKTFHPEAAHAAQSSSGMYVRDLLEKFGGYFRFICRDCFFSPRPMISGVHNGTVCLGQGRHSWAASRIIAHVKDTAFTPVDERKYQHDGAFYLMCHYQIYCTKWHSNKCGFAHSHVERSVWMLERDTKISRDELVQQSTSLFIAKQTMSAPPPAPQAAAAASQTPRAHIPQQSGSAWQRQSQAGPDASKPAGNVPPVTVTEYCRTCWGKGQRSEEDKGRDKCVRGHSNFKLNSVFVALPAVKEIRSLPSQLSVGMKLILCEYHPKCTRRVCNHPHGQEELEVWGWMLRNDVKTLREVCDLCKEAQKQKTRKIDKGESVISVTSQAKPLNQIITPGDLHIHEHYCQYCGTSCNSDRQWDEHCMSERHINNVNSDREHQWNFRQPPWGQGGNLQLCAKHLHNKSCQYSYVPDMYNMCNYAHSQEELDEWRERYEWRQMKRTVARDRNMFSYTESLLDEYHRQGDSVNVISDSIAGVKVSCNGEEVLYRTDKNDVFTWTYQIHTQKPLEKVALLLNKDRLHFKLLSTSGGHHQMALGDGFLDVDTKGKPCYKVTVHFNGGIFGSFSQWVVFDFGSRPVLRKKLSVEIGDQLQHVRVKELREELHFDRWTSQNREIVHAGSELTPDPFTQQLLNKYKEPSDSPEVVTSNRLTELNQHNYIHKMHGLLELEEITRQAIISRYNLCCEVTFSKTLQEPGMFLIGTNGDLFIKVNLTENLSQDTLAGKLVLSSVRTALLARTGSNSRKVYEASLVGERNYGYDGRGKEYVYLVINTETSKALGVSQGQTVQLELQFQMDRRFFCRMHHALDCLQTTDVVFPDVLKFKPDISQLNALTKIRSSVLNEDQMIAVRHIVVEREGYTPPFIMYGPFGTGKTETLAQATMTLLRERKDSCRILICTQSNSAADLYITKHLHAFVSKGSGKNLKILRLNAAERRLNTVPEEVLPYCHCPNKREFEVPSKAEVVSCNLVLTTVENSLVLATLGLHGCFTHIFVDEAGQTLECEILMPVSLATSKTCVVLTGDHHQIGPTVYSQEARRQNFGVSILVRLFNYYDSIANCGINLVSHRSQKSPLNIFLSINYRTKTEILRFISSVFYGGPDSLKAYGKIPAVVGITPLMLYAVQGRESQNEDSTSYLNHAEAQEVVAQVGKLLDNWPVEWGARDPTQIAVISTYTDQVKHVRKMLRQDKKRPLLSQVDVGPIHSFQGKEVRALFITTVRTTNLLREPHILRSLEANEDIGDLGFMSDPKLLNTALTRTQSFVAVVGDPCALCLIGECTQIWRTYLKHCSNMSSVRPMSYTYEAIKNMVQQIHLGPEGYVIQMITKREQEGFKHMFNIRKTTKATEEKPREADEGARGDADTDSRLVDLESQSSQPSSLPHEAGDNQEGRKQNSDDLVANSSTISDDILFQLARESSGSDTGAPIQAEGISITVEQDSLAVLRYSPRDQASKQLREPYRIVSEDNDFVAFRLTDEDTGVEQVYENWGRDTLWQKLSAEPNTYLKGLLTVHRPELAVAAVLDLLPSSPMAGKQIEIWGLLNRGHALDGDTVVVEVIGSPKQALQGRVKGILERAQDPSSQLYMCRADVDHPGILLPVNPAMPRFYTITSTPHVTLAKKGYVCLYQFDSRNCIEFSNYEKIEPSSPHTKMFIVRYLFWQPEFLLPCAVVVGVIQQDNSIEQGMKMLDIEYNVQRSVSSQLAQEAATVFPSDSMVPTELQEKRRDLTPMFCFSIGESQAEDVEMVISVNQTDTLYEVGVHVADVAAYVDKDSVIDQECEQRGVSLFPAGQEPIHMFPVEGATDVCSLRPGLDRLAMSVVTRVDGEGRMAAAPEVFSSVVNSKKHFTHAEVEEILLCHEEAAGDYLKSCIIVLYQLAFLWRQERLGNAHLFSGLPPHHKLLQHSQLILKEVKLQFDSIVARILLRNFPDTTPLFTQPRPVAEKLEKWKLDNAVFAIHSIPLTRAFLDNKVCRCATPCTCVFSYIRYNKLENIKHLAMLSESWSTICQAVSEEFQDFELAQDLLASPEHVPRVWLAAQRLAKIQQPETYVCSDHGQAGGVSSHHSLCLQECTSFTQPLRSFMGLVVQRMVAAFLEGVSSPYNAAEMRDLCGAVSVALHKASAYHRQVFLLHLSRAILTRPVVVSAVVEDVTSAAVTLNAGLSLGKVDGLEVDLPLLSPLTVSDTQMNGTVTLHWMERIYQYPDCELDCEPGVQHRSSIKLDPDRLMCNIPFISWQKLLIAVRTKDDDKLQEGITELSLSVASEMAQRRANQPQVLRSPTSHLVPFSLSLTEGQTMSVQLCAKLRDGFLQPFVQLLQLTSGVDVCLEHRESPEKCFIHPGYSSQAQATYSSEEKYLCEWLLPALALESARQAVKHGERVTIHGIEILWSSDEMVLPGGYSAREGTFSLTTEFCERSSFWPQTALLEGHALYSQDANFSLDFLCIRHTGLAVPESFDCEESVAALLNLNKTQPITWVGHCRITEVKRSAQGFEVKVILVQSSTELPSELRGSATYTVEWISKTDEHRTLDIAARGLLSSSQFVKDIISGKKPLNTLDPVPPDSLMSASKLQPEQEAVVSSCYRQPFHTVVGGPGTSKSIMAARLAHLLVNRNTTTDSFGQPHSKGPSKQLMICAPTEQSLDVITGYFQHLNFTNVRMVRVYSQQVEERDFPLFFTSNPRPDQVSPCAVMEDLALHHRIRHGESPEIKEFLEQELLLAMSGGHMTSDVKACMERAQLQELRQAQVILCTPLTSARPVLRAATRVTQIILDDASLIPESEAIVPLVMHRDVNQLVMFGDSQMPWRSVSSELASQLGLARPLLLRFAQDATCLRTQYRATEAFSRFPLSHFYSEDLTSASGQGAQPAAAQSIPWPGQAGTSCVFCHVQGEETHVTRHTRPGTNTTEQDGWVNLVEVQAVVGVVQRLVEFHQVAPSSILVVTATHSQAVSITNTLGPLSPPVDVCSVLDTLGREKDYVILSTVRSVPFAELELPVSARWTRQHLGNMADGRMVNLAITRARTALFIFGNKDLLGCCEPWKSLINSFRQHQCFLPDWRPFLESLRTN